MGIKCIQASFERDVPLQINEKYDYKGQITALRNKYQFSGPRLVVSKEL